MENWKTIEEFPKYEASDLGNIRNKKSHRILKQVRQNTGYFIVSLRNETGTKTKTVHRLIAQTWVKNDNPKLNTVVNHKNFDKTDNRAENLEWLSSQQNTILGCGPTELRTLKAMVNNAMNKAINEWYSQILTLKAGKEVFTEELINTAMQEAYNTLKNKEYEY